MNLKKGSWIFMIGLLLLIPVQGFAMNQYPCQSLKTLFPHQVKTENGVCKLEIERTELKVKHMGHLLGPEMMELSFGVNFKPMGTQTMVMGEFALLGSEVQGVIDALRSVNLEISALHNHMYGEKPRILYLHFQGMGNQQKIAKGIKQAINQTKHIKQ